VKRLRADQMLVANGLCQDLAQARQSIIAGQVRIGADHVVRSAAELVAVGQALHVTCSCPYVSRGAYKLEAALQAYPPPVVANAVCLDIGASTGGFTDLLLHNGAARVYAVDVGYGQLHYRLRQDARVVVLEKTHARDLNHELVPELIDLLVVDVSFISVTAVLAPAAPLLRGGAWIALLIKPQFEAARADVAPGGIVTNPDIQQQCVQRVSRYVQQHLAWEKLGVVPSPLKGAKAGNQEYLLVCRNSQQVQTPTVVSM